MSPSRLVLFPLFLTLVLLIAPLIPVASAQGVPWYTIPLPVPNGFVDVVTGNVHLEIPLGSMPQRNGDPIVSKMVYDTTSYTYSFGLWNPNGLAWRSIVGSSHTVLNAGAPGSGQTCTSIGLNNYPNGSVTTWSGFWFKDIHGTTHATPNGVPYETRTVSCFDNFGHAFGNSMDITSISLTDQDGLGFTFQISNYNQMIIYASDGTILIDNTTDKFSSDNGLPIDPNGNIGSPQGSQPNLSAGLPSGVLCGSSTVTTSSGSSATYTGTCTNQNVSNVINGTTYTGTVSLLTSLALPDGTSYSFSYDTGTTGNHYGTLTGVTLPGGGAISFTYTGAPTALKAASAVFGGGTWGLSYSVNNGKNVTTVLAPSRYDSASHTNVNDQAVFTMVDVFPGLYLQTAQYYSGSSTLLKTVAYNPSANSPTTVTTTLNDTGQSSQVSFQYFEGLRNFISQKQETDFTGTIVRTTKTNYTSSNFIKPTSINVYAGSGTGSPIASTLYTYDEYSANYCKNGVLMLASFTGAYRHDDTNFGTSYTTRGNVTTVQRLISGTTYSTAHMCYDTLGNVTQTVDANGNPTSYDYSENWADTYCIPSGTITHAFPTTITDALGHRTKKSFFTCTVLPQSIKDENDIQAGRNGTTFTYEFLDRPLTINYPDGGQTTYCYSHNSSLPCYTTTLPPFTTDSRLISGSTSLNTKTLLDSYGRVAETQLTSDPQGTVYTDTTYDALGHVSTVSNPYRSTSDSTYGITTYDYDALGRTTVVIPPDGTTSVNNVATSYAGNCTTVVDQTAKARKSCVDALDRLTQVFEDPAGLNYETDYAYDVLDNLLTVNQKGGSTNSVNWRTRTFVYDSLSRLTSSTNPESNTQPVSPFTLVPTTYVYDSNGNLFTKTAPAPNQTGTATLTTTYTYDALNRLTQKSFSDSTPTVKYAYDAIAPTGCTLPTLTIGNGIGKRTGMCDAAGAEAWSYDITASVGWKITDARTTNSVTKSTTVQNNLAGSAATLTYPSGRIITYTFNAAARPVSVVDSTGPINYATAVTYAPAGASSSLTNGASIVSTFYFNNRLQPCRISVKNTGTAPASCTDAATGNVLDFSYNFSLGSSDNGNVTAITNNRDTTRSQTFTSDSLNRIATAKTTSTSGTTCWDESFGYDPWGNLLTIGRISGYSCSNEELLNSSVTLQNKISGDTFDTAGNLTAIPSIATYTYNAESQLTATAGVTYTYDGDGKRVQKSGGKIYWYGLGRDPLDETDLAGNVNNVSFNEYIFFGGKRIARRDSTNNVNYYFSDHLGTARIVANSSGTPVDDSDFYPFGGERNYLNSSPQNYKFTGKERDSESGLDNFGARYFGSSLGRFMRPDPQNAGASPEEPQSWNAYAYAGNNPLNNTDPDGLNYLVCDNDGKNCADLTDKQYDQFRQDNPNLRVTPSGDIYTINQNGTETKTGSETYYNEKDADAAAHIAGSQLLINEFVKQVAINVAIGAIGRGIGLGIEAIQASRAANAAAEAAEAANLAAKAAQTVGNQGAVASSQAAAMAAGEEFVGPGAQTIVDRATGQVAGKISADGSRVYRITSINKAQPYVNLENKATGGNLHVRF